MILYIDESIIWRWICFYVYNSVFGFNITSNFLNLKQYFRIERNQIWFSIFNLNLKERNCKTYFFKYQINWYYLVLSLASFSIVGPFFLKTFYSFALCFMHSFDSLLISLDLGLLFNWETLWRCISSFHNEITCFSYNISFIFTLNLAKLRIDISEIMVGDIVQMKSGMRNPCDAILVKGAGVTTDESAMASESIELKKETMDMCEVRLEEKLEEEKFHRNEDKRACHDLPSPILLSGTQIETGEGYFMVLVVGKNCSFGKILSKLNRKIERTPLQEKLIKFAKDIGKVGMIAAGITLVVLFARFFIETGIKGFDWSWQVGNYLEQWFRYILISITIVVVAVPEGLPLAVMIALAYSVRKMLKDMNFVKRLASWEIMGGANKILCDKTGTLIKNKMNAKELWKGEVRSIHPEGK